MSSIVNHVSGNGRVDVQAAFAEHERWLRTAAFSRLGSGEGVDEVMQEVALAVVRQSAPLSDPAKLAPWLHRLVVHQALLYRRRHGRQRKLAHNYAEHGAAAAREPATPLVWLVASERQAIVRRAMEQLPRRDRELLLLKYTENWSYVQIASHLGLTPGAVESRLHRARGKLRSKLASEDLMETRGDRDQT